MNIRILNYTGIDSSIHTWNKSRPNQKDSDFNDIMLVDAPVNDMPRMRLLIESTIIEREIFATFRDHIMWAQSSRVEDISKFRVNRNYRLTSEKYFKEKSALLKKKCDNQDINRLHLPLLSNCKYVIDISPRSLIKVHKVFVDLIDIFNGFSDAVYATKAVIKKSGYRKSIDVYKPVDIGGRLEKLESGSIGSEIVISVNAPFSLRTHAVRQRGLHVDDNLIEIIKRLPNQCLLDECKLQLSAPRNIWSAIISKRTCWLAQYGLWKDVVEQYVDIAGDVPLPCSDGICPYVADNKARIEGLDPNPPCPKYLKFDGSLYLDKFSKRIHKMVIDDNRLDFWHREL